MQNILVFRFGNGIFEPIWNRRYVDNVQVSVGETVGVEGRGGYYEEAGALRDMVQNHLLQVLALVAMEPVASFRGDAVRDEKAKVFQAIVPIDDVARDTVRAPVRRWRHPRRARCRATARRKASRPTSRDRDVRRAEARDRELALGRRAVLPAHRASACPSAPPRSPSPSRQPPLQLFRQMGGDDPTPNLLVLRIQPDEGISLRFGAKVPGTRGDVRPVNMDFRYGTLLRRRSAGGVRAPAARRDARRLDAVHALGQRRSGLGAADARARRAGPNGASPLEFYEAGSWGPTARETSSSGMDANGIGCKPPASSGSSTTTIAVDPAQIEAEFDAHLARDGRRGARRLLRAPARQQPRRLGQRERRRPSASSA